jgi:crotonobetainyl-CoA:carnitine CoA-transferase CaiB-like acyl-CoA transferase
MPGNRHPGLFSFALGASADEKRAGITIVTPPSPLAFKRSSMTQTNTDHPLSGLRVLDLSRVLAGPWASQTLGDLGAEVIKVERPERGDDTRSWGPPWIPDADGRETTDSAYFLCANRNKKSVTIDITAPKGQELVREIAAKSDILIENFKAGGLAKYRLDYASLAAVNSRLIYCSITGFGQTGPSAHRAGYDFSIQGLSGLMSVTGAPATVPGSEPQKIGVALVDILTGLYATNGILAAVQHRHRTGRGQHIDLALFDTAVACLANQALNYLVSGQSPERLGNANPNIVPYQAFATSDGHLIVAVGNDGQFRKLCDVIGAADLAEDARFATNASRVTHRAVLVPILETLFLERDAQNWIALLEPAGVPCGPINSVAQAFAEPRALSQQLAMMLPHDTGVLVPSVRSPLNLSGVSDPPCAAPPSLGQHTEATLRELLGASDETIAALRESKII